jgi:hypothetical protein
MTGLIEDEVVVEIELRSADQAGAEVGIVAETENLSVLPDEIFETAMTATAETAEIVTIENVAQAATGLVLETSDEEAVVAARTARNGKEKLHAAANVYVPRPTPSQINLANPYSPPLERVSWKNES